MMEDDRYRTIIITWKMYKANKLLFSFSCFIFFFIFGSARIIISVCIMQIAGWSRWRDTTICAIHKTTRYFVKLCKCNYLLRTESLLQDSLRETVLSTIAVDYLLCHLHIYGFEIVMRFSCISTNKRTKPKGNRNSFANSNNENGLTLA